MKFNLFNKLSASKNVLISLGFLMAAGPAMAGDHYLKEGYRSLPHTKGEDVYRNVIIQAQWYEDVTVYSPRTITYTELVCENEAPEGKGDWKGYFELPYSEKANALAKAIAGIGPTRAKKIVEANQKMGSEYSRKGYFRSKPKSWNLFQAEIDRIENELDLKNLFRDVVVNDQNRRSNLENLAYAGNCREVTKQRLVYEETTKQIPVKSVPISVDVYVENYLLLSGESEQLTLRYDGGNQVSLDSVKGFNSYQGFYDGRGSVRIQGTGRIAVRPNVADFGLGLSKGNGSLVLDVTDNRFQELSQLSPNYKLQVSFKLFREVKGCGKKDIVVLTTTETLDSVNGQIDLTKLIQSKGSEQIQAGGVYYIYDLSFERIGTPYFGGTSGTTQSAKITY